jgi:hypothetical protein
VAFGVEVFLAGTCFSVFVLAVGVAEFEVWAGLGADEPSCRARESEAGKGNASALGSRTPKDKVPPRSVAANNHHFIEPDRTTFSAEMLYRNNLIARAYRKNLENLLIQTCLSNLFVQNLVLPNAKLLAKI